MNGPRVQAMFKRSRHNISPRVIISQDYYQPLKRTIRAYGNMYHIFKRSISRDVQNLYQDKASMDMTPNEFKYLTSTCWDKQYQPLSIDMTKGNYIGRCRLGLFSLFIPDSNPFRSL